MPRKPLGLRPIRESAKRDLAIPLISIPAFMLSDGTWGFTGDPVARDRADAAKAWPHYRRRVWAATYVGHVPRAATIHDGLTTYGHDELLRRWNQGPWESTAFDLDVVLEGLNADRAAVEEFQSRDLDGAATIRDFLTEFLAWLDRIDVVARDIRTRKVAVKDRLFPGHALSSGTRYGELEKPHAGAPSRRVGVQRE